MSFDTDYPNRKDRRKPYRRSKAFDRTCRNHGSCPYCASGRLRRERRQEPIRDDEFRSERRALA